ncbi:MAG: ABC transporter permease [Firmicutes bacterium]|nr:ABC transporter permease [Bacillota bacterium]
MGSSLSLEELEVYAGAESVQNFYYTLSASVNGSGSLEAYSTSAEESDESDDNAQSEPPMMSFGGGGKVFNMGEFTLTGYSSDAAMTDFVDGTCTIEDGAVFDEGTSENVCIISDELAEYNGLAVGDSIKIASVDNEDDTYKLKVVGIYKNSQASAQAEGFGGMFGGMGGMKGMGFSDPANNIYCSYNTLAAITEKYDSITGTLNATYVLGDVEAYESFQNEVKELGLSDEYTVSSSDITAYEQSARPLENLAKFAGYFLIVILIIGAIILVVLNIFATRERKYEIGVMTAIGMKKARVAKVFMAEILAITLAGVVIGGGIGAAVSVPVTNALLSSQIEMQQENMGNREGNFGREFGGMMPGGPGGRMPDDVPGGEMPKDLDVSKLPGIFSEDGVIGNYVTEVSSSVNLVVLLELLAVCIALAVVSGMVSVIAIMRYEPLQILANRD